MYCVVSSSSFDDFSSIEFDLFLIIGFLVFFCLIFSSLLFSSLLLLFLNSPNSYLSEMSIGTSKFNFPFLTKIISSIKSPSFIKTSFFSAKTGLNANKICTIKSVLLRFLKNIKLSIIFLYIAIKRLFRNPSGRFSIIMLLTFFSLS